MLGTVERLRKDAGKCAVASLWSLSDADLAVAIDQVHQLEQTIAAVKLHLITEIEGRGIPASELCRGTAAWLRSRLRLDPAAARQMVEQAAAVRRHPAVDQALCAGTIQLRHAAAICDSLDALPSDAELAASAAAVGDDGSQPVEGADAVAGPVDSGVSGPDLDDSGAAIGDGAVTGEMLTAAEVATAAEAALLKFAGEFSPAPLRRLGARILDHVAPQVPSGWKRKPWSVPSGGPGASVGSRCRRRTVAWSGSAAISPWRTPRSSPPLWTRCRTGERTPTSAARRNSARTL